MRITVRAIRPLKYRLGDDSLFIQEGDFFEIDDKDLNRYDGYIDMEELDME